VGTGEVLDADGRKVVGVSQRRTRNGSWFHSACVRRWDPDPLLDVLALSSDQRRVAHDDLMAAAAGIDDHLTGDRSAPGLDAGAVVTAFANALPPQD
jgi:lipoate-protein ligase A